jgi:hypothetical protein
MIDDKSKDLYKSIKAPDALRERILKLEAEEMNTPAKSDSAKKPLGSLRAFGPLLASAASFAIIVSVALVTVLSRIPATLTFGGSEISDSPVQIAGFAPMGMRITPDATSDGRATLTFALNGEGQNTVTVTQGDLTDNADSEKHAMDVHKLIINGGGEIIWHIAPGTRASITIRRGIRKETYALEPVGESGVWTITKID